MAKSKQEVRQFLETLIGLSVNAKSGIYQGQCVSLIKALLEFLGAPDPYKARGNAKDYGDALIREGIGKPGQGFLTVCVNRDMGVIEGVRYGHIWLDLLNESNFEQNGNRALRTTKNTRPIQQAQQFVNLDQWLSDGGNMAKVNQTAWRQLAHGILGRNGLSGRTNALDGSSDKSDYVGRELDKDLINELFISDEAKKWRDSDEYGSAKNIQKRLNERDAFEKENAALKARIKELEAGGGGKFKKIANAGQDIYIAG